MATECTFNNWLVIDNEGIDEDTGEPLHLAFAQSLQDLHYMHRPTPSVGVYVG